MLTEICAELKNYFIDRDKDIHSGQYAIVDGSIDLPFLLEGQYFRIVGSVLNDGVWQYPTSQLSDEVFDGAVWAMRVPPSLIALAAEIEQWQADNAAILATPFQSESFGNYSYTTKGAGSTATFSWQNQFASKLNPYRRLFVL